MKITLIALILVGFVAGTFGVIKSRKISNQSPDVRQEFPEGSLLWYVQQAKDKGQKEINIAPTTVEYGGSSSSTTLEKILLLVAENEMAYGRDSQ